MTRPFDWATFDARIDKSGECWLWTGRQDEKGYGVVWKDGRHQRCHRISYERATGVSLGDLLGCHRCDTPACVRPDHIFPGTHSDNFLDMWRKGRGNVKANGAILTELAAKEIVADPRSAPVVAAERGVSPSTIKAIRNGRNWKHLGIGSPRQWFRPTSAQREEIRGARPIEVGAFAVKYGVPAQAIRDIRRKRRAH